MPRLGLEAGHLTRSQPHAPLPSQDPTLKGHGGSQGGVEENPGVTELIPNVWDSVLGLSLVV